MEVMIVVALASGLYMAWNIGANDVANSMADAVGSKAVTIFWAVILAGVCEFAGAVLVGSHVTNTIRKGIVDTHFFQHDPRVLAHGMLCAMLAAAVWLNAASFFGMPVSTTHSIVGAIVGFGVVVAGLQFVHWTKLLQIVSSWFLSPIAGGLVGFTIFKLLSRYILSVAEPLHAARRGVPICTFVTFFVLSLATIYKGLKNLHLHLNFPAAVGLSCLVGLVAAVVFRLFIARVHRKNHAADSSQQLLRVERCFGFLVIITSCTVAFAHGANDVANAIGPLAAVIEIEHLDAVPAQVGVELWILVLGGLGIVLGLACFGYRVMQTVGTKVTEITPSRGVSADIAAMVTVLSCSKMGLPVSTTHTLVGSIMGVGIARGLTALNRKVVSSILLSWLITVPIAAVLSILFYGIGTLVWW